MKFLTYVSFFHFLLTYFICNDKRLWGWGWGRGWGWGLLVLVSGRGDVLCDFFWACGFVDMLRNIKGQGHVWAVFRVAYSGKISDKFLG